MDPVKPASLSASVPESYHSEPHWAQQSMEEWAVNKEGTMILANMLVFCKLQTCAHLPEGTSTYKSWWS